MKKKSSLRVGRPLGHSVQHYKKIADAIIKKINSGSWSTGFQLPSRARLASTFRVGERTIRRALDCLAQDNLISKTPGRQWIVRKSEPVFSFQSRNVALFSTYYLSTFWTETVNTLLRKSIELQLLKYQKHLRLYDKRDYSIKMRRMPFPDIAKAGLDGIFLHGFFTKSCFLKYSQLNRPNLPIVRVDAAAPSGVRMAAVCVDNVAASKDAVMRLFQLGHRRIAFCRSIQILISEVDPDSQERQEGYLAGIKKCGIKNGKLDIYSFIGKHNPDTIRAIFNARPRYTAVVAVDGVIAQEVENEAINAGMRLPQDLSIVAFEGLGEGSKYTGPRIDFEHLGREAVELLVSGEIRQVRIPTTWYEGSTLSPPSSH
jgi:DNA-binding LacI/PurR family transcriptional regulator